MSVSALAGILRRKGFEVLVAHTVQAGLDQLAENPEWLLLDLMLPDGSGEKILEFIRTFKLPTKVVVVTAVNDLERLQRVRDLQPHLLMKKPLDLPGLLRTFEVNN